VSVHDRGELSDIFDAQFDEKKPKNSVYSARSPEFLMYYMRNQSDVRIRALYEHSYKEAGAPLPPDAFVEEPSERGDRRFPEETGRE
jgi:hypothetical protein